MDETSPNEPVPVKSFHYLLLPLLILLLAGGGNVHLDNTPTNRPAQGDVQAPDFALEQLNGETFRLSEQQGRVVVVNLWASWCGPCRREIPDLAALHEELDDVVVLGVSLDKRPPAIVEAAANKFGINYPVVIDDGTIREKYGPVVGIPMTYIIGKEGRLHFKAVGQLTDEELRPVLRALADGTVPSETAPRLQPVERAPGQ